MSQELAKSQREGLREMIELVKRGDQEATHRARKLLRNEMVLTAGPDLAGYLEVLDRQFAAYHKID